jgi:hypothetical protein
MTESENVSKEEVFILTLININEQQTKCDYHSILPNDNQSLND